MDTLERRVEMLKTENQQYKKQMELLEADNSSVRSQIRKLEGEVRRLSSIVVRFKTLSPKWQILNVFSPFLAIFFIEFSI